MADTLPRTAAVTTEESTAGTGDGLRCSSNGTTTASRPPEAHGRAEPVPPTVPAAGLSSTVAPRRPLARLWKHAVRSTMIVLLGVAFNLLARSERALLAVLWLMRVFPHRGLAKKLITDWVQRYFGPGGPGKTILQRIAAAHPNQRRRYLVQSIMMFIFADIETEYTMPNGRKIHAPALVLITPTQRCPLRCRGCYAGNYSRDDDLPTEVVWRVIEEARALGTRYFVILGGEPMVWEDLWETAARYSDCAFQVYTSGHTLDRATARRIAELGNIFPCVSIEGLEHETNWRRGKGGFERATAAMDALHAENVLFGYSCTVTHRNVHEVVSEEFADFMVEKGAIVGWYFLYMPVGLHPDVSLMPTAEDRNALRQGMHHIRSTRPLLAADFWGDGPLTEGCLSGGRRYVHINNFGDVEPCIFIHHATHNIKECSLAEALGSDFFQAFQRSAPWGTNLLRPCPIIDHPQVLRGLVKRYRARGTHPGAETIVSDPKITAHLDAYSKSVQKIYDPIFAREYNWVGTLLENDRYDWSRRPASGAMLTPSTDGKEAQANGVAPELDPAPGPGSPG